MTMQPADPPPAVWSAPPAPPPPAFPAPAREAVRTHTSMMAVDIASFGSRQRDERVQCELRHRMYGLLQSAFAMTCLPWDAAYREDRGDGALVILPRQVPTYLLLDPLAHHLNALLRRGNLWYAEPLRMRLRLAVHAGYVHRDAYGVVGRSVNHLFRLLDSAALRAMLDGSGGDLGMIVSDELFGDVADYSGLTDTGRYRAVDVVCKETRARGWVWLTPGEVAPGLHVAS
ncbi:hypothetical protein ACFVH6_30135 [Spirillospora sp. NPDC127200]